MKNNLTLKHKNVVKAAIRSANAALRSDDPAARKEAWNRVNGMKIEHAVLITNTMAKLSKVPLLKVLMKDPKSLDSSSPAHVIAVNLLVDFMALQFDFMHLSRAEIKLRKSDTEIAKDVLQAEISYNQTILDMMPWVFASNQSDVREVFHDSHLCHEDCGFLFIEPVMNVFRKIGEGDYLDFYYGEEFKFAPTARFRAYDNQCKLDFLPTNSVWVAPQPKFESN